MSWGFATAGYVCPQLVSGVNIVIVYEVRELVGSIVEEEQLIGIIECEVT